MADRYWVGGTDNWNGTAGTKWATTSGGAGGAAIPTSSDNVYFDSASNPGGGGGNYTVTLSATANCDNLTLGHPSAGTLTYAGSAAQNVYGDVVIASGVVYTHSGTLTLRATSAALLTLNGTALTNSQLRPNGTGGSWTLTEDLVLSGQLYVFAGSFDANGYNVTVGTFNGSGSTTRSVLMGSGTWTITDAGVPVWDLSTVTNLTFNAGTSTIKLTDSSASNKTVDAGGRTYNNIWFAGAGTGQFRITGGATFNELKITDPPHSLLITAGTTITAATWTISGTSGNLNTIQSITSSAHTLAKSGGGVVSADYLSIAYSTATPGSTFYAGTHSTNGGTNSGWTFTAPPASGPANVKSWGGALSATVKTAQGLAIASVKTWNGIA